MNGEINYKKWLTYFFGVLIIVLAIFFLMSELMVRWFVEPQDLLQKHRQLFLNAVSEGVVFGDSHPAQDFTGQEGFINLAFPAETMDMLYAKMRFYLQRHSPKKVIFQADPHMFSSYRLSRETNTSDYIRYMTTDYSPPLHMLLPRHRENLLHYWKTLIQGKRFESKWVFESDGAQTSSDVMGARYSPRELSNQIRERVRLQLPVQDFSKSVYMKKMKMTLDLLKETNASVCVVTYPVSKAYVSESEKYSTFSAVRNYIRKLVEQYGFVYRDYWDYFSDDDFFANADHLNKTGAQKLSKQIVNDCFQK